MKNDGFEKKSGDNPNRLSFSFVGFQQAIRTSHGRRPPGTASGSRPLPGTAAGVRGSTGARPLTGTKKTTDF